MANLREEGRRKRHRRVRLKVRGAPDRARLTVFRSHLQIYAQIIDDTSGNTLVSSSSLRLTLPPPGEGETRRIAQAKAVGQELATRAKAKGIEKVTFDRSGYRYHGRVAALAQGAREGGLVF